MVLTAVLIAQYAGTIDYFETSRIDARSNQPFPRAPTVAPQEIAVAADASFSPAARVHLTDRRWDYTLSYSPTFSVTDVELPSFAQPVVLNAGTASIAWHDRRVRFVVSEGASFGWENLAYLYGTPVAGQPVAAGQSQAGGQTSGVTGGQTGGQVTGQTTGQTLGQTGTAPTVPLQVFPYGSSSTSAGMQLRAARSVTLSVSGGYSLSGDLTNNLQAKEAYPEQFGPSAAASVAYASSPADSVITTASAQETTTPRGVCPSSPVGQTCREVTPILLMEETARHGLSHTATVSGSLGVSATVYQLVNGSAWAIFPAGGVAFIDRLGPTVQGARDPPSLRLSADLAPTINIFTGLPSTQVQINAALVSDVAPGVVLSFVAGDLQTVPLPRPDPSPLTILSAGVDARMRITRLISIDLGVQAFRQKEQNVGALPVVGAATNTGPTTSASEVGYISLVVRTPTLRF